MTTNEEQEEYSTLLSRAVLSEEWTDKQEFLEYSRILEQKYGIPIEHLFPPDKPGADGPGVCDEASNGQTRNGEYGTSVY